MPKTRDEQDTEELGRIQNAASMGWRDQLFGSIATSLLRIANAQESMVELAKKDIETIVESEVQGRAEALANEIAEDKTKRSFIGRKA